MQLGGLMKLKDQNEVLREFVKKVSKWDFSAPGKWLDLEYYDSYSNQVEEAMKEAAELLKRLEQTP